MKDLLAYLNCEEFYDLIEYMEDNPQHAISKQLKEQFIMFDDEWASEVIYE